MTPHAMIPEPSRINEPSAAQDFSNVLTQVAEEGTPLIVRRNGKDLAAVISMEQLDLVREIVAQRDLEARAAQIKWQQTPPSSRPPQKWFDDTDNPFEPEASPT